MGAPKLKLYLLAPGYVQTNDTDVQYATGDELLPVIDKSGTLSSALEQLVGVMPVKSQPVPQFNQSGGRLSVALTAPDVNHGYWYPPSGTPLTSFLQGTLGTTAFKILDVDNNLIPAANYTVIQDPPGTPAGFQFVGTPPTVPTISAYALSTTSGTYALPSDGIYTGTNPTYNKLWLSVDGAPLAIYTPQGTNNEFVTVTGTHTSVVATMYYVSTNTRYFVGASNNWVGGHMNMWPDIFQGLIDYPGDQIIGTDGTPTDPLKPGYLNIGTYQLDFRDGMVIFPAAIDTTQVNLWNKPQVIYSNYAHLIGIGNVTGQVLDPITGSNNTQFQAASEAVFPDSHGKRWVGHNDQYTPRNIYVQGTGDAQPQLTPQVLSMYPWEQLTIKTGP
jgi:hypothetical protein